MFPGFSSPPNPQFFYTQVWEIVSQVPAGKVITYGQIAALIPLPPGVEEKAYRAFGARWVGGALAACPPGIPWYRVINAQGKISLKPGKGENEQRELLEAEGIEFDTHQRVSLKRYAWQGPQAGSQAGIQPRLDLDI